MREKNKVFSKANIMIPHQGVDMSKWSVVACDQYTSERDYWEAVRTTVGKDSSTLNLVFPELYLEDEGFDARIEGISRNMKEYLQDNLFQTYEDSFIYVKRTLANGQVRNGIVGKVDLECYDYTMGANLAVRATEGTVLERIPPRVKVREQCPLEFPHVMVLIDDEECKIIEKVAEKAEELEKVYDFPLMMKSGSIEGYLLDSACEEVLDAGLETLMDKEGFQGKYDTKNEAVLTFAVGDGNHSLATAKKCYENLKAEIGERALESNARYALVELVNLHDESLEFEAIHRVVFGVDETHMYQEICKHFTVGESESLAEHDFLMVGKEGAKGFHITNPESNLAVGDLQKFIDGYIETHGGSVDYIHGEDVVKKLCQDQTGAVGFLLKCMEKSELYKTVIIDGVLPRKTFSMGAACDKRFYLEGREIC